MTQLPFTAEDRLLFIGTSLQPDREAVRTLLHQVTDWDIVVRRGLATHLAPLLYRTVKATEAVGIVPPHAFAALYKSYNGVLASNIRLYAHLSEVISAWNSEGIPLIVLKGMFLAEAVYGDIGLRHISDLDLLVRNEDVERCVTTLRDRGWEVHKMNRQSSFAEGQFGLAHPYKFGKGETIIELHVHILNGGTPIQVDIRDYWERSTPQVHSSGEIRALHPNDLLQHLCLHLYKHLHADQIKMCSFCDIRETIIHYNDLLDWEQLMQDSKRYNCLSEVQEVLFVCRNFWGIQVPPMFFSDSDIAALNAAERVFLLNFHSQKGVGVAFIDMKYILTRLGHLKGPVQKAKYVFHFLFPSMSYMNEHYRVNGILLMFCYAFHPFPIMFKVARAVIRFLFTGR